MPKILRDAIFVIFIILLVIISVVTSLQAAGYRFNFKGSTNFAQILVKTGSLHLSTSPKGAIIHIDNRLQTNKNINPFKRELITTPAKIKNLIPGKYTLTIEKEGYWPWQKEFYIDSGLSTNLDDINLFKSDLPVRIHNSELNKIKLSPSNDYLYLEDSKEVVNLKLDTSKELDLETSSGLWLKNKPYYFSAGISYSAIDGSKSQYLADEKGLVWKYNQINDVFTYSDQHNNIYSFSPSSQTSHALLLAADFIDYNYDGSSLTLISQVDNKKYLEEYDLGKQELIKKMELPNVANYSFSNQTRAPYLSLYDSHNLDLYLINKNNWLETQHIANVKNWIFVNKDNIIYHNDWEIVMFNLENLSSTVLNRFSDPIENLLWHSRDNYYIFASKNSIYVGDIKTGIITKLFTAEEIAGVDLDVAKNTLYFSIKLGQQTGVYKLLLK